jgi:undecaprenyl diphosphate synthase
VNREIDDACNRTAANTGMTLTLALSYGGRQEIIRAATLLAADLAAGRILPGALEEAHFERYLYSFGMPEPDLLIRTSGEMRISNFLLWQLAYTELYFTDVNWPDFGIAELHKAFRDFQARERRFGRTSDQLQPSN